MNVKKIPIKKNTKWAEKENKENNKNKVHWYKINVIIKLSVQNTRYKRYVISAKCSVDEVCPVTCERDAADADGLYLWAVSQRRDEVMTQRLQVGLRLVQVGQGVVQSHRGLFPLAGRLTAGCRSPSSLLALSGQQPQCVGGSPENLGARLDAELETK